MNVFSALRRSMLATASVLALSCATHSFAQALPPHDAWIEGKTTTNEVVLDPRFGALLRATTPWFIADPAHPRRAWATLAEQFAAAIHGPPDDVKILDRRYIVLGACMAHNCGAKGLLWLDTATGISVGAVVDTPSAMIDQTPAGFHPGSLLVFSRTSTCHALPAAFRDALAAWVVTNAITVDVRSFVGRSGRRETDCL